MQNSSEISVIVQGHISEQYTPNCLRSIRKCLPNAEIILSTTDSTVIKISGYDKLILTEDPGAYFIDRKNNVYNNINRQIVSTRAGLENASRPYSLKFRTDMTLKGVEWLNYFGKYDLEKPATYFKNRVLVCDFYTRNPRIMPVAYHPSDWIMFGWTEDLKRYYAVDLQDKYEILWFDHFPKKKHIFAHMLSRYTPEQYLCINFLKQFKMINFQNYYDNSPENICETERFFAENLVILNYGEQIQITFEKYSPNRYHDSFSLVHNKDWQILFNHYCGKQKNLNWIVYVLKKRICKLFVLEIRQGIIKCLSILHLKEPLKKLLRVFFDRV